MGRPVGEITKRFTLVVKHNGNEQNDNTVQKVVGRPSANIVVNDGGERVLSFTYKYQKSAANAVKRMTNVQGDVITFDYSTSISEN